jgi:hypothetical protein
MLLSKTLSPVPALLQPVRDFARALEGVPEMPTKEGPANLIVHEIPKDLQEEEVLLRMLIKHCVSLKLLILLTLTKQIQET